MKLNYKKHFTIHDIVRLVQYMAKDREWSYSFLILIGCTLGYKIGVQLRMNWSCFVDENGKAKDLIVFEVTEPRKPTKFLKASLSIFMTDWKSQNCQALHS